MKIKTSELIGRALDWAVAKIEGRAKDDGSILYLGNWLPSTDWSQGGPIIEREKIALCFGVQWCATKYYEEDCREPTDGYGPTALTAAMRCYVASKLGDEVEIPEELL